MEPNSILLLTEGLFFGVVKRCSVEGWGFEGGCRFIFKPEKIFES